MTKKSFNNNLNFNKLNNMKIIFMISLIMSTLISINSNNWINAWMGMEINLLSFIPLMINKKKSPNSTMMYFIIQSMASSIILFMTMSMKIEMIINKLNMMISLIMFSLLIKMGAAPLHWWTPKIFLNLNWKMGFMFLTWQKIAPLILLNSSMNNNLILYMTMMSSIIMGAIMGLNQSLIKLILIYSSINHTGWMIMALMLNISMMMMYFIIYTFMNLMICITLNNLNTDQLNQLLKNNNQNVYIKMMYISLFLSLGGMPPLLGFLPKMMTLMMMMNNNMIMESLVFVIMATISLSFYMNPLLSMFLLMKLNSKWNNKNKQLNKSILMIFLFNFSISLLMIPMILKIYLF